MVTSIGDLSFYLSFHKLMRDSNTRLPLCSSISEWDNLLLQLMLQGNEKMKKKVAINDFWNKNIKY